MNDVHINYNSEHHEDDFNKKIDQPLVTSTKNQKSQLSSSASEISILPMQPQDVHDVSLPEEAPVKHVALFIPSGSQAAQQIHLIPQSRPEEDISQRLEEHEASIREKKLMLALHNLNDQARTTGGLANQIKYVATHPAESASKAAKTTKKVAEGTARFVPFIGPLKDSQRNKKIAQDCHKKVKEIQRELDNPTLPPDEAKNIETEIKKLKKEKRILKLGLKELDKAIANEIQDSGTDKMQGRIETRNRLQASIKKHDLAILENRAKLCNSNLSDEVVSNKLAEMDQLVAKQKKHERKGYGHDVNVTHSLGSALLFEADEIAKLATEITLDAASTITPVMPVTRAFSMTMAGLKAVKTTRNLKKAFDSFEGIKKIKQEASTYKALAEHYKIVATDPAQPEAIQDASKIEMEIELEKVQLIKDYLRIQKKYLQTKVATNGLGLASAVVSVGANTCGLLVMVPEPVTSSTMYGLAAGLTGVKVGLLIAEFSTKEASRYLEQKAEKKLWTKRDFFEYKEHEKGISRSFLGVEIRLAHMMMHGFAPPGVLEYHGIFDEKGYIEQVSEKAQTLADRQELKKGIAIITEYKGYVEDHYNYLANQRDPSHIPPKGGFIT